MEDKEFILNGIHDDLEQLLNTKKNLALLEDFSDLYNKWFAYAYELAKQNKVDYIETAREINKLFTSAVTYKINTKQGIYASQYLYLALHLQDYVHNGYLRYVLYILCWDIKGKYILNSPNVDNKQIDKFKQFLEFMYTMTNKFFREFPDTDKWCNSDILTNLYKDGNSTISQLTLSTSATSVHLG